MPLRAPDLDHGGVLNILADVMFHPWFLSMVLLKGRCRSASKQVEFTNVSSQETRIFL